MVTESVTSWLLILSELDVPNAAIIAARAVDHGFQIPQRSEFAQAIEGLGYAGLIDFFTREGWKKDREIGRWLGFSHMLIYRHRKRAERLAAHG